MLSTAWRTCAATAVATLTARAERGLVAGVAFDLMRAAPGSACGVSGAAVPARKARRMRVPPDVLRAARQAFKSIRKWLARLPS